MSGDRLPHACYGMLNKLDDCNRVTWASNIKILLCKFGFEYIWNAHSAQDENAFLCIFEDRVKQHFVTLWLPLSHGGCTQYCIMTNGCCIFTTVRTIKFYFVIFKVGNTLHQNGVCL